MADLLHSTSVRTVDDTVLATVPYGDENVCAVRVFRGECHYLESTLEHDRDRRAGQYQEYV